MEIVPNSTESSQRRLTDASNRDLLVGFTKASIELVRKEVELAKTELRRDLKREVKAAAGLGTAAFLGMLLANVLIAAAILVLAIWLPAWASALIVAALVLCAGGLAAAFGWTKRVKTPLEKTQKTIKEDVRWAKERLT